MKPKTFNLALREPKRDPRPATRGFRKWNKARIAQRRADAQRYTELQTITPVGTDLPVCMVCGGRAATWDGHAACRGRR